MGEIVKFSELLTKDTLSENIFNKDTLGENIKTRTYKNPKKMNFNEHLDYIFSLIYNGVTGEVCPFEIKILENTDPNTNNDFPYLETDIVKIKKNIITSSNNLYEIEPEHLNTMTELFKKGNFIFTWKPIEVTYDNEVIAGYECSISLYVTKEQLEQTFGVDFANKVVGKSATIDLRQFTSEYIF